MTPSLDGDYFCYPLRNQKSKNNRLSSKLQLLNLTFVCCRSCSLLLLIVEPWGDVGHVHEHTDRDGKVRKGLGHGSILVRNHVHRIVTIKST